MKPITREMPALLEQSRYPFHHMTSTRFADIDPNHHINNVALAAALEDARVRFSQSCGLAELMPDIRVMIVANYIDYVGEAHYPAPLDMHMGTLEIGRSSWTLACLASQGEQPCACARAVNVATRDGRPVPLDENFRAALERARVSVAPAPV
jgi:acyl-CoA thioester hydrolase